LWKRAGKMLIYVLLELSWNSFLKEGGLHDNQTFSQDNFENCALGSAQKKNYL